MRNIQQYSLRRAYPGLFDVITSIPLEEQLFSVPIESIEVTTTTTTTTTTMPAARCINFNPGSMPQWLENLINWFLGFAGALCAWLIKQLKEKYSITTPANGSSTAPSQENGSSTAPSQESVDLFAL
jgi:hypothetical protein